MIKCRVFCRVCKGGEDIIGLINTGRKCKKVLTIIGVSSVPLEIVIVVAAFPFILMP
jgi:hypothetical protein